MFVQDNVGRVWAVYYNNNLQYLLAIMIHRVIGKTYHGKVVGRYIMLLGFTFFYTIMILGFLYTWFMY